MLRKRTSFKPNIKQVVAAPQPATQPAQPPSQLPAPQVQSAPATQASQDNSSGQQSQQATAAQPQQQQQQQSERPEQPNEVQQQANSQSPQKHQQQPHQLDDRAEDERRQQFLQQQKEHLEQLQQAQQQVASSSRVQEAITQLTGQKFEPLNLRSSANKNVQLRDLLAVNPPLTRDQKRHKKKLAIKSKTKQPAEPAVEATTEESEPTLVPKVKMGPEGQLILDESSTIIHRKNAIKEQEAIIEDDEDVVSRTNYDSFRRKPSSANQTKWSLDDTRKFYHALTILGTDFSMMESLLFSGTRSRTELHKKFKREERVNKSKIDIALSNRISLSTEELKEIFNK